MIQNKRVSKKTFGLIYFIGFFIAFAEALPAYIHSSFLSQFVDVSFIGLYITGSQALIILVLFFFSKFIQRFSNYRVMLALIPLYLLSVVALLIVRHPLILFFVFAVYSTALYLFYINLDVFLENISDHSRRLGQIRTTFLTLVSLAWFLSPFAMGKLVGVGDRFWLVYPVSSVFVIFVFFFLLFHDREVKDHYRYKSRHFHDLWLVFRRRHDLAKIFELGFALRFFYAIMVLYTPLHLHHTLGFSWEQIGIIFTIMLLPFLIIQMPAGRLADKYVGEKEFMVLGIIIMMVATGAVFFLKSDNLFVWAVVLFTTRVGAALLDSMEEVYFFKMVHKEDVDLINFFRDLQPVALICASLFSVLLLQFFPLPYVFFLVVIVLFLALRPALTLQDTR